MEKFIVIISVCLVLAIILGIVLGTFLANSKTSENSMEDLDENEVLSRLSEVEALYSKEKELTVEYDKKNRELKGQLLKKMTLLSSTSDTLKSIQRKTPTLESQEVIDNLQYKLKMKNKELKEFEEVLWKAEKRIEEFSK